MAFTALPVVFHTSLVIRVEYPRHYPGRVFRAVAFVKVIVFRAGFVLSLVQAG